MLIIKKLGGFKFQIQKKYKIMKTQINCNSRLEVLTVLRKLEKYGIDYIENEKGILADITPERAFNIGLI